MDIARYFEELLNEHEEVSIPGVGKLSQKAVGASFDSSSNTFYPPKKILNFNPTEADSNLLAQYIAKVKNLSLPSATYFAEQYGITIQADIKANGVADISPLGSLTLQADQYVFTPFDVSNKEYFGLPPVKDIITNDNINIFPPATEQESIYPVEPVNQPSSFDSGVQPVIEPVSEEEEYETEVRPRKAWPIILVVLTALAALGIVGILSYPDFFNNLKKQYFSPASQSKKTIVEKPKTITDSLATADSILSTLQQEASGEKSKPVPDSLDGSDRILNALQKEGFEVKKIPDTIADITTQKETIATLKPIRYEIIGASLGSTKEAEKYIAQLKAKGIDARISDERRGRLILISLGSFTDKTKAENEKKRIQAKITTDAWILEIKK